jgi:hypothetical protein
MKITLMAADKRRQHGRLKAEAKEQNMINVARIFINGPLKVAIEATDGETVNVEVPADAYRDLNLFYGLCMQALNPLGYTCEESHDGGGMYNTLYVTWKEPFKKTPRCTVKSVLK